MGDGDKTRILILSDDGKYPEQPGNACPECGCNLPHGDTPSANCALNQSTTTRRHALSTSRPIEMLRKYL